MYAININLGYTGQYIFRFIAMCLPGFVANASGLKSSGHLLYHCPALLFVFVK